MIWKDHGELFLRCDKNPILTVEDWPYQAHSVFNPAAAIVDGITLLMVRVEDHRGFSHFTVARSKNGIDGWEIDTEPTFAPDPVNYPEEIYGIEDPRITYIDEMGKWAVAYTAFSDSGPLTALAFTEDFRNFDRVGPTLPPENKDAAIFPVRFNGKWAMLHRPVSGMAGCKSKYLDILFSGYEILGRTRGSSVCSGRRVVGCQQDWAIPAANPCI